MKKKIKDLTLEELRAICKENIRDCKKCPIHWYCQKLLLHRKCLTNLSCMKMWEREVEV